MKQNSIGQFVKEMNVAVQTLRNWNHTGKLKPDYISLSRHVITLKNNLITLA